MGNTPSTSLLPALPTTTTQTSPVATSAAHYVFTFGDSYTATGFSLGGPAPNQNDPLGNPTYPGYTSTSGPNWIDELITTSPKNTLFYNFAVGGATVDGTFCGFPGGVNPFTVQAATFIDSAIAHTPHPDYAQWTSGNSVFIIWFGVNDIDLTVGNAPTTPPVVNSMLDTYFKTANRLVAVGARRFVFLGIPPLWRLPGWVGQEQVPNATAQAQPWNGILQSRTTRFNVKHPRVKASFLDIQPYFKEVLDHPKKYGAPDNKRQDPDGKSCLWVDGLHPGQAVHRVVAAGVKGLLSSSGFFGRAVVARIPAHAPVRATATATTATTLATVIV